MHRIINGMSHLSKFAIRCLLLLDDSFTFACENPQVTVLDHDLAELIFLKLLLHLDILQCKCLIQGYLVLLESILVLVYQLFSFLAAVLGDTGQVRARCWVACC
jgi:hypothetical protein